MKAKHTVNSPYARLYKEVGSFLRKWPYGADLDRLAISFATNGHVITGSPMLTATLLRAAIFPQDLREDSKSKSHREFKRFFGVIYARSPDLVLALLSHIRRFDESGPIQKYLTSHEARGKSDCEVCAALAEKLGSKTKISEDTVRKARQRLAELETEMEASRQTAATEQHETFNERMRARYGSSRITLDIGRKPKGQKRP